MKANHWIISVNTSCFVFFPRPFFFPFPSVASWHALSKFALAAQGPLHRILHTVKTWRWAKPLPPINGFSEKRCPALRSTRCLKALLRKLNCISTCPQERHPKKLIRSPTRSQTSFRAHFQWRPTWSHQFKVVHLEVKWSKFRGFGKIPPGNWSKSMPGTVKSCELHLKPM